MLRYNRKNKNLKIPVGIGTNNNVDSSLLFNVSDGDATAGDLIAGKTAYSAEGFIVGTLDLEGEKTSSYNEGYSAGEQDGYVSGEADGYADGYSAGKEDGIEEILTEQSDANITPGDVLEGYIGYGANNERIVGTNVGGFNFSEIGYTETDSNQTNRDIKDNIAYTKSLMPITPSVSLASKFSNNLDMVYAPYIDTSITTNMSNMFFGALNLKNIPTYDYSNVTNISGMFRQAGGPKELNFSFDNNIESFKEFIYSNTGIEKVVINAAKAKNDGLYNIARLAQNLKYLEIFNIPNTVTDLRSIFRDDRNLEYVRLSGDTSNVASITGNVDFYFQSFNKLHTVILDIDTHFLTSCYYMFGTCSSLTTVSLFNTSNVTNMYAMFNWCDSITTVPLFDTRNVTNMGQMFRSCDNLLSIPQFNTVNVTNMSEMFIDAMKLTTVPLLNTEKVDNVQAMFGACYELTNLGGFENLGKGFATSTYESRHILALGNSPKLTRESLLNVFNNLYDMNQTSITHARIVLTGVSKGLLTAEDIAIATNKGWTIQ